VRAQPLRGKDFQHGEGLHEEEHSKWNKGSQASDLKLKEAQIAKGENCWDHGVMKNATEKKKRVGEGLEANPSRLSAQQKTNRKEAWWSFGAREQKVGKTFPGEILSGESGWLQEG